MFETRLFENFSDLDRTFAAFDALRRRRNPAFDPRAAFERAVEHALGPAAEPRFFAEDAGDAFVCRAELPGVPAQALELTLTGQVLKVKARRATQVPEGFVAHRRERATFDLVRSVTLPTRVDAERVTAVAKDGVVTITLPKAADTKPRNIAVQTA